MFKHRLTRLSVSSSRVLLAAVLALFIVGAVAAQSQLPGKPLTTHPANDLRPAWSPDGAYIAYFSARTGNNDIWVMNADGTDHRQLTTDPADDRRPVWSPDGQYIAFDSDRAGSRDLWVMDSGGGNLRQLTSTPGHDSFASWSPDGTQVAFYSYEGGMMDIWTVALGDLLQGGEAGPTQRVTTALADENRNDCTFACHVPAWSPDSNRIAYQANHGHTSEVWVVGADGSDPHAITDAMTHRHYPWWTADGRIIILHEHINSRNETVNDVYVVDADGGNPTLQYEGIPHGGPLYWAPDGGPTVAFHSPRAGNFDIYWTVLGEEAVEIVEPEQAAAEAVTVEEVVAAEEAVAETPEAAAGQPEAAAAEAEPTAMGGAALTWVVVIVVGAVAGGLLAVFMSRRRRSP